MTEQQTQELANAFVREFDAEVEVEPVGRPGRYRFAVSSQRFESMTHLARQDALWQIVDHVLPRDATLDVSMILAFAPGELEQVED